MKTSIRVVKRFSCAVLKVQAGNTPAQHNISGDNSLRVPPVPIPNTEVKPQHADGTWLATARESRSSPDSILFGQFEDCPFLTVLFLIWQRHSQECLFLLFLHGNYPFLYKRMIHVD